MYAGGFKQVLCNEYICWMQVKIHISDQTSLRICNSVLFVDRKIDHTTQEKIKFLHLDTVMVTQETDSEIYNRWEVRRQRKCT